MVSAEFIWLGLEVDCCCVCRGTAWRASSKAAVEATQTGVESMRTNRALPLCNCKCYDAAGLPGRGKPRLRMVHVLGGAEADPCTRYRRGVMEAGPMPHAPCLKPLIMHAAILLSSADVLPR